MTDLIVADCQRYSVPENRIQALCSEYLNQCLKCGGAEEFVFSYDAISNEYTVSFVERGKAKRIFGSKNPLDFRFLFQLHIVHQLEDDINDDSQSKKVRCEDVMQKLNPEFGETEEYKNAVSRFISTWSDFQIETKSFVRITEGYDGGFTEYYLDLCYENSKFVIRKTAYNYNAGKEKLLKEIHVPDSINTQEKIFEFIVENSSSFKYCKVSMDELIKNKALKGFIMNVVNQDVISKMNIAGTVLEKFTDKEFDGEVVIPTWVKEISSEAFMECKISGVVIRCSCERIGNYAFAGCRNLKNVKISAPERGIELSDSCFMDCDALEEVDVPRCYGKSIFENCTNLKIVRFDDESTTVGKSMFKDCVSLKEVYLPKKLFSIQEGAFGGCSSLGDICLPDNLQRIYSGAFENCTSLQTINIPGKVRVICSNTFSDCISLKKIEISDGVNFIEDFAFKNCNVDKVDVPESVLNLGEHAFDNNTNVSGYKERKIIFPDAVKDIVCLPSVGERVKPIYHNLFRIEPREGYEVAFAAINLMTGYFHRIDSKQVSYGVFLGGEDDVCGLPFEEFHQLAEGTEYADMTPENWRDFIPTEELEKAAKNIIPERYFDDTFTEEDNIGIDGLYIKLTQRFGINAFYFRKTQTGYRLYCAKVFSHSPVILFKEKDCNEEFLYSLFIALNDSKTHPFTFADEEKDIALYKDEFKIIVASAHDLFSGEYEGRDKHMNVPISIYGNDYFDAVLWKNGKAIPCADYPGLNKVYDVLTGFWND